MRGLISHTIIAKVLTTCVETTSAVSETTLLFNPWIISPSGFKAHPMAHLRPITCTVMYAILEPALTWALLWMATQPWILLLICAGCHLQLALFFKVPQDFTLKTYCEAAKKELEATGKVSKDAGKDDFAAGAARGGFCMQIITAAARNAALLLLAQSLEKHLADADSDLTFGMSMCAFIVLLCSYWPDYNTCESTARPIYIGQNGIEQAKVQLGHLAVLLVVRCGLRMLAGWGPFACLEVLSAGEWQERFGLERYVPGQEAAAKQPKWQSPLCSALSITLSLSGGWYYRRLMREDPPDDEKA